MDCKHSLCKSNLLECPAARATNKTCMKSSNTHIFYDTSVFLFSEREPLASSMEYGKKCLDEKMVKNDSIFLDYKHVFVGWITS